MNTRGRRERENMHERSKTECGRNTAEMRSNSPVSVAGPVGDADGELTADADRAELAADDANTDDRAELTATADDAVTITELAEPEADALATRELLATFDEGTTEAGADDADDASDRVETKLAEAETTELVGTTTVLGSRAELAEAKLEGAPEGAASTKRAS